MEQKQEHGISNPQQKFNFDKAVKDLMDGKQLNGKDGILAPLVKQLIEAVLEGEVESHISRKVLTGNNNRKNGYSSKTMKGTNKPFELNIPRDRNGSFEPQIVKKYQTLSFIRRGR